VDINVPLFPAGVIQSYDQDWSERYYLRGTRCRAVEVIRVRCDWNRGCLISRLRLILRSEDSLYASIRRIGTPMNRATRSSIGCSAPVRASSRAHYRARRIKHYRFAWWFGRNDVEEKYTRYIRDSALKEDDRAPSRRRKWDCPICRLSLTARGPPTGSTRMRPDSP